MSRANRRLSEAERDERRRQDRERLQRAAEELLSSEGWARWVRVRATFHSYSAGNCMLIALQCHQRGIVPQRVAGFRAWLKLGRCVSNNEKALRILAPVTVKERDERGEETGEGRVFFKTAFVFELSQTELLAGVEPAPLEPPCEPLTGDSHAYLIEPLRAFAQSLGYTVSFEHIEGPAGGWCDLKHKGIVVDADAPANRPDGHDRLSGQRPPAARGSRCSEALRGDHRGRPGEPAAAQRHGSSSTSRLPYRLLPGVGRRRVRVAGRTGVGTRG
ncbi:MAG: hypothetical protein JWN32_710 [Solirubrobacterales bacterium]|nr:hypothetical protein [Solirubrobacterales bacterium]